MRKIFLTALLALAVGAGLAEAAGIRVGVGAFGGVSVPIVNDLSKQGSIFGVRVPVKLVPVVTIEPYFASSSLGDVSDDFGTPTTYTRDGGKVSAYGANALLTFGGDKFQLYPFVGLASFKVTRAGAEDISDSGYNFGLGLGISPISKLTIHVRGEFSMIATGDTSQKFANANAGVSYALFSTK